MSRILVWGINYSPEVTGIAPYNTLLCEFLASRGHRVEMVTTFPYYPAWKKRSGDRGKWFRTETKGAVVVHRSWHYVPRRVTAWRRICHEASFVLTSFLRMLFLSPPDLFVVVSPPLLLGPAAWLIGFIKSAPFLFHVQDLQPDAAMALAMLKKGVLVRGLYRLEGIAYDKAAAVSAIS